MIIKIRVPNDYQVKSVMASMGAGYGWRKAEILEVTPELTEQEKLLSKIFGLNVTQDIKETLAQIVNKVYEKK